MAIQFQGATDTDVRFVGVQANFVSCLGPVCMRHFCIALLSQNADWDARFMLYTYAYFYAYAYLLCDKRNNFVLISVWESGNRILRVATSADRLLYRFTAVHIF